MNWRRIANGTTNEISLTHPSLPVVDGEFILSEECHANRKTQVDSDVVSPKRESRTAPIQDEANAWGRRELFSGQFCFDAFVVGCEVGLEAVVQVDGDGDRRARLIRTDALQHGLVAEPLADLLQHAQRPRCRRL